jgi:uncharacterized membrane protein
MDQAQQLANRIVVEDNIVVRAPIQQVYTRWDDFTRFPEFMSNVEEVRPLSGNRYHWVARIFGVKEEWDAEVTDREPERRISWRSYNGAQNAGTVMFSRLGPDKTEIRVRFEYTPPAGTFGKSIAQLTKPVKKEVKEDLKNFRQLVEGKKQPNQQSAMSPMSQQVNQILQQMPDLGNQVPELMEHVNGRQAGNVLGALTIPVAAGVAGGLATYYLYQGATKGFSITDPSTWISVPAANMARWRLGAAQSPFALSEPVSTPASIGSWSLLGACVASILGAVGLRFANKRNTSLFIGQWAPTFLGLSALVRMVGNRNMRHDQTATAISWGLLFASLGAIGASLINRIRGKKNDSLFIGQWAPTFLGGAVLARLLNR